MNAVVSLVQVDYIGEILRERRDGGIPPYNIQ